MKKNLLILIAIILFFTACSKKNCCMAPKSDLYISADKDNNKGWTADPASSIIHADTIAIFGTNYSSTLEETITMNFKISGTGKYDLNGDQASYYNTVGRDVITSEYALDDSYANAVNVTAYDADARTISGTFNLKFKHVYPAGTPQQLQFLNGKFKVLLHK